MTRSIHRLASDDLAAALRFYEREAGELVARRFLREFERIANLLERYPALGTATGADRRSIPPSDFPYSIIYRLDGDDIRILVVRHQNRDPGYGDTRG